MKRNAIIAAAITLLTAPCAVANSPYIKQVHEYNPAPGQFVNTVPEITSDMTADEILASVTAQIAGNDEDGARPGMITLGAYGGYVVFSFDHPVVNVKGQSDFKIYGNAFKAAAAQSNGGSSEPGIVMVSVDANGNGIADDEWFELAGSEYKAEGTMHQFEITYQRPANDTEDIAWTSNDPDNARGTVDRNQFHTQSYWPVWNTDETMTFKGTRLAPNAVDQNGDGTYWVQNFLDWGYVDNLPNDEDPGFNIENAVDADGNAVELESIHFIKVYTGVNFKCGWLGETSTEITGGEDLHPDAVAEVTPPAGITTVGTDTCASAEHLYNLNGVEVARSSAPAGIYILVKDGKAQKTAIR